MKIRIADRVVVALAGVALLLISGCVIAQSFFSVPVLETMQAMLSGKKAVVWLPYVLCIVLLALSGYCIALLFRRRKGRKGFVLQETDGGELSIALSAMDGLVGQCVAVHAEMELLSSAITTEKDGVVVDLRVALANGVSIPLAVDALQKQIRQYVTSCSGVTVREVRVQVDSMDNAPVNTPYAVPTMLQSAMPAPLLTRGEEPEEKPLHQRIFSDPETPVEPEKVEENVEETEAAEDIETEKIAEEAETEAAEAEADEACVEEAEDVEAEEAEEAEVFAEEADAEEVAEDEVAADECVNEACDEEEASEMQAEEEDNEIAE